MEIEKNKRNDTVNNDRGGIKLYPFLMRTLSGRYVPGIIKA